MGIGTDLYNFLLLLHLIAVVVGFGTLALNGVYGAQAKQRAGAEGAAIGEANAHVSIRWAEIFIYTVPVSGILLVLASDGTWEFSQLWISLAFLLYIVGLGVSHMVMIPTTRRMNELARQAASAPPGGPPPQAAEMEQLEKKLGAVGGGLNLLVVALLAIMVWKPGV
jgi:uncharacterized membrane protein